MSEETKDSVQEKVLIGSAVVFLLITSTSFQVVPKFRPITYCFTRFLALRLHVLLSLSIHVQLLQNASKDQFTHVKQMNRAPL